MYNSFMSIGEPEERNCKNIACACDGSCKRPISVIATNLLDNIEDLDPEFSTMIDEDYWNLV